MPATPNLASVVTEIFGLPLTTLAIMIAFRYEVYESIQNYADNLVNFITAEVEEAGTVTPADVHEWSGTLRYAFLYRRCSNIVMPIGYACIITWLSSVSLSRLNPLGIGNFIIPIIRAKPSMMAAIFSLGLFSILLTIIGVLFYIDHSRIKTTKTQKSPQQTKSKTGNR